MAVLASMNRRLWMAVLIAGTALVAYGLVFRSSPEERVRRQIAALVDAGRIDAGEMDPRARPRRIQRAFQRLLAPTVRVEVTDLVEDVHGRDELAGMAISAEQTFASLGIDLGGVRVEVDPSGRAAWVRATALVNGRDHDGHHVRDMRALTARLAETDGEWRITELTAEEIPEPAGSPQDLISERPR